MRWKKIFSMKLFAVTTIIVMGLIFMASPVSRTLLPGNPEVWAEEAKTKAPEKDAATSPKKLPLLIDIGQKKCAPCDTMAPILEQLKNEYKGRLTVVFINVRENSSAVEEYNIRGIPTQIFYDASGKELGRHLGFISKEQILQSFKKFGIEFKNPEQKTR